MNHDSRFAIFGSRLSTSPHATVMGEDIFGGMNFGGGIFAFDPLRGQKDVRGHPYLMSALRGERVSPKDVVREVA